MIFDSASMFPSGKISCFSVVAIIGKMELGPDEEYAAIKEKYSAIVTDSTMHDRHADVTDDVVGETTAENISKGFPGVIDSVLFCEMVFTAVSWNLQLRADLRAWILYGDHHERCCFDIARNDL